MKYCFNQSKKFQSAECAYALFDALTISFLSSVFLYAVGSLIAITINEGVDTLSADFILPFVFLFVLLIVMLSLVYFKTDKGVWIENEKIIFKTGYWAKDIPIDFPKTYGEISLDDIVSVELMESYSWSRLRRDYKNYNYGWIFIGNRSKGISVAAIEVKSPVYNRIYMLALEDNDAFISDLKIKIQSIKAQ